MEPIAHIRILRDILPTLENQEAEDMIRKLEAGLASTEWRHKRLIFLGRRTSHAWEVARECHRAGAYRITVAKMREVARQGLVTFWRAGKISSLEIGAFADDIASIRELANSLLEAKGEGCLAPVWEHAFDPPPDFPEIHADLTRIFVEDKKGE